MKASLSALALFVALAVSLTGCWDRWEINELGIVSAAGFDLEGKDIVVTVELFRPPVAGQMAPAGAREPLTRASIVATGRGPTVVSAIRDLTRKVPRRIYWALAIVVIVGEDLAKHGLEEVLDLWDREAEPRRTAFFLVAKGRAADVVIESQGSLEATLAEEVRGLQSTSKWGGYSFISSVHEVISGFQSDSRSASTGIIEVVPEKQPPIPRSPVPGEEEQPVQPATLRMAQLSGVALFVRGKLVAEIPISPASRGLCAAAGKINGTALDVPCPCREVPGAGRDASEETENHMVELKLVGLELETRFLGKAPRPQEGSDALPDLRFEVKAKVRMSLSSQQCNADLTRADLTQKIQKEVAELVAGDLGEAVETCSQTSCDAFGFARALHIADPELFRELKDHWPEVLKKIQVVTNAEAVMVRAGSVRKRPTG